MIFITGHQAAVKQNGELRKDVPAPVPGGTIALPGDTAGEYRNFVLIPILPAR